MPFSVREAIDQYVESIEEEREPDGLFHPSGIFNGCDRKVIYEVRGTPPSNQRDAASKRILRVGHTLHDFVQSAIEADPTVAEAIREVKVFHPLLKVKGSVDQLIRFLTIDTVEWELEEYKTISSWGFKHLVDENGKPAAKPEHVKQALTYVIVLRELGSADGRVPPLPDLHKARITYVDKQDLKIAEFVVELDDDIQREILAHIATLESYRDGVLPERLQRKADGKFQWQCNYCQFQTLCWEDA